MFELDFEPGRKNQIRNTLATHDNSQVAAGHSIID
jgi:hypothetical protein